MSKFLLKLIILSIAIRTSWADVDNLNFPPWFKFGASTASYQVEGAWNISDKTESIWDRYMHTVEDASEDGLNGDVASDSYHQWQRDVEVAEELGLDHYRFSLNWPRLLPNAFSNYISKDGKNYYNNLIDGLLERGIEPMVTLYHWELPQKLQDLGGWVNPNIVDWFADYARTVFSLYGDRVVTWVTINEPTVVCDVAYSTKLKIAPDVYEPEFASLLCNRNLLLAHAKAWRIYHEEFKPKYHGRVSISNHLVWLEPVSEEYTELTELALQYNSGRYTHPIFSKQGGWPPSIERIIRKQSLQKGFPRSRLPPFTKEEIEFIKGTYDYFAFNHYTSRLVRAARPGEPINPLFFNGIPNLGVVMEYDPNWDQGHTEYFQIDPKGLRNTIAWLRREYGDLEFVITENGYSNAGEMKDPIRIKFIHDHLEQILLAIKEDNAYVTGYTYWSLFDCFEWMSGYNSLFGLYAVDFSDPDKTRSPRLSAAYITETTRQRALIPLDKS